jgi:hypothetical protein
MNALQWGYELVRDQEKMSENKLNQKLDLEWKKRHEVLSETCKKITEEANKIREETTKEISNIKQEAEQRLSIKDKILQDMQKTLNDAVNEQVKNATSEYKRQLEEKENDKTYFKEQFMKLQEQLKESNDKKAKNNISANKGKEGENKLETLLRDAFYGATITPTHNIPGQMDMHLTLGTTKIMIDAKNHEREIKKDDVEKFKTDLHNSESSVGILIGLNLNIPKHNSHFIETKIVNNKLEIYMNQLLLGNAIERLRMLSGIIEIWDEYVKVSDTKNSQLDVDTFKQWETNARRTLNNSLTLIIALNTTWTDTKKSIEKSMDGFSKSLTNLIEDSKNDLKKLGIQLTEEITESTIDSKPKRSSKKQSSSPVSN